MTQIELINRIEAVFRDTATTLWATEEHENVVVGNAFVGIAEGLEGIRHTLEDEGKSDPSEEPREHLCMECGLPPAECRCGF